MPNEEKEVQGGPTPASGEQTPQGEVPNEDKSPETPDYKAELEKKESALKEREEELKKKEDQLGKAGYTIQKLRDKMKEAGIEPDEGQTLTEDQVQDVVSRVIEEKVSSLSKENQELKAQLGEVVRSISSSKLASMSGGEGGQKPPKDDSIPRPKLSPEEEKVVQGLDWDSKRGGWVEPRTKRFQPHIPEK